jgi:uncharacterized protein YkwD
VLSAWAVGLAGVALMGYLVGSLFLDSPDASRSARHAPQSGKAPDRDRPEMASAPATNSSNANDPDRSASSKDTQSSPSPGTPNEPATSEARPKSQTDSPKRDGPSNDSKERPKLKLSQHEQLILDLTNGAREKERLSALKPNAVLCNVARAHAANMARKGEMNHVLDGKTPVQRVQEAGYQYRWTGENVAYSSELDVRGTFRGWMESTGHRENILRRQYQEIGIGIAIAPNGEAYYSQVFGTPQ